MVSGINSPAPSQAESSDKIKYETKEDHATLDRDDFMHLFVTQLQYQDPMNPMKSAEMASQVAQFNMVDLMYKNNTALAEMAKAENTATSVSAVGLLGREVEYKGDQLFVDADGPRPFFLQIPDSGTSSCQVTIKDSKGRIVKQLDIGAGEAGSRIKLDWDATDTQGNQVPEGTYHVSIQARDLNDNDIDITTWTTGTVDSIDNSKDGLPKVSIKGGPILELSEIKKVQGG